MPSLLTHYLFGHRVMTLLGRDSSPAAEIGFQGPDIFFFHRVLPWQWGVSYARQGSELHKLPPSRLIGALRDAAVSDPQREYVDGFICHYMLDRAAHPFVLFWQEELAAKDPSYGKDHHAYHFRIESALDTIMWRRMTGRRIQDTHLKIILPLDENGLYTEIAALYLPIFHRLLGIPATTDQLRHAPGDTREAARFMTDRFGYTRRLLWPVEWISRQGAFASSLLRPFSTKDEDYANLQHRSWHNPACPSEQSQEDFFALFERTAHETADVIRALDDTAACPFSVLGNRSFSGEPSFRHH